MINIDEKINYRDYNSIQHPFSLKELILVVSGYWYERAEMIIKLSIREVYKKY